MRLKKKRVHFVIVLALTLCAIQVGVWARSTVRDHSETDKIDSETAHHPTELPGLAGTGLLVLAGILLSIPNPRTSE